MNDKKEDLEDFDFGGIEVIDFDFDSDDEFFSEEVYAFSFNY